MSSATSHAPSRNLLPSSITVAANVSTSPTPLITALRRKPAPRVAYQWRTIPTWESVNPTNTPTAGG
jgi:hypothetical protein